MVGDDDPFAEQFGFQGLAGGGVDGPAQPELGWGVAGEGGPHDPVQPAGPQDAGDLGFDAGAVAAAFAAVQDGGGPGQCAHRFGYGLVQPGGLFGVQVRRVGQHHPPLRPERGRPALHGGQPGVTLGVDRSAAAGRDGQQRRVVRRGQ